MSPWPETVLEHVALAEIAFLAQCLQILRGRRPASANGRDVIDVECRSMIWRGAAHFAPVQITLQNLRSKPCCHPVPLLLTQEVDRGPLIANAANVN